MTMVNPIELLLQTEDYAVPIICPAVPISVSISAIAWASGQAALIAPIVLSLKASTHEIS